jgi:hypothetical protein
MTFSHFIVVTGPRTALTFTTLPRQMAGSGAGHDGYLSLPVLPMPCRDK